jgi:hypothetical protein
MRRRLVAPIGLVFCLSFTPSLAQSGTTPRLFATVGSHQSISLVTAAGTKVKRIRAGVYLIRVRDWSRHLNFDLIGPRNGLGRSTTISFVGNVTWRLKLVGGTYSYQCDVHPQAMRHSFRVT